MTSTGIEKLLQEQYQADALARGDIDSEDFLELDPDNVKSIKKAFWKWLEQKKQEALLEQQKYGFDPVVPMVNVDDLLGELST